MSLEEELRAAQLMKSVKCAVCKWLELLPENESSEWDIHMADVHSFGNAAIVEVLRKRQIPLTEGQIKNHRASAHRVPR